MRLRGFGPDILKETTGYLYFIQMDRIGPIKIGFTKNIANRLIALQTSSPYPLNLLCITPSNENQEKEIHSCYDAIRLEGEWFLPHPLVIRDIENIKYFNKKNGFNMPNPKIDFHPHQLTPEYDEWLKQIINCQNISCREIFGL